ncbi:MAG: hypothetical protein KGJ59_11540 [Bacteroidota bacterium]|nr:hypothetical protein [Bacteroidota bacterium]
MNDIGRYIAFIIIFGATGLTVFTKYARAVDVVGLLACGAVIGISIERMIAALKAKRKTDKGNTLP